MEDSEILEFDPDQAALGLIDAIGKGIKPSPETAERLIAALKAPVAVKAEAITVGGNAVDELQTKVLAAARAWMETGVPGSRHFDDVFKDIKRTSKVYDILTQSLLESLEREESLLVIAQKLTFFHNSPKEYGGQGYSGMYGAPTVKRKLLERLLKELKEAKTDMMENDNFHYIFYKALGGVWASDATIAQCMNNGKIAKGLKGNRLYEAILKYDLQELDEQEKREAKER